MTNAELLLVTGLGLVLTSLAVILPPVPARPLWLPLVLGIAGAVCGALVFLTVLLR